MEFGVRHPNSGPLASIGAIETVVLAAEELGYAQI